MAERLNAKAVIELLRNHYIAPHKPAGGYFCPELPDPADKRRADLIWVPTTWQERGQIIGHEVKVSRADVVAELNDPTKADAWARYCDQWWLVVSDPSLIDGLDIPEHWGVMAPPSGRQRRRMTVLKDAPTLKPAEKTLALANVLARLLNTGDDVFTRMNRLEKERDAAVSNAAHYKDANERLNEQMRGTTARPWEMERLIQVMDEVEKRTKNHTHKYRWLHAEPSTVAVAILDMELLKRRTLDLRRQIDARLDAFQRALEPPEVTAIVDGLDALSKRVQRDLDRLDAPVVDEDVP
ncbi:hypothetical protein ACWGJ9_10600 [Curtobacterium citreum]